MTTPNLTIAGIDFRKQSARRALVVASSVSCILLIPALWLGSAPGTGPSKLLALLPGAVLAFGWWVLNQVMVPYAEAKGKLVDERQAQVRDRAFFRAYQVVCSLTGFFLVYLMVAATAPRFRLWSPQTAGEYAALIYLFLFISITLPHAFVAWWEPDYLDSSAGEAMLPRRF